MERTIGNFFTPKSIPCPNPFHDIFSALKEQYLLSLGLDFYVVLNWAKNITRAARQFLQVA